MAPVLLFLSYLHGHSPYAKEDRSQTTVVIAVGPAILISGGSTASNLSQHFPQLEQSGPAKHLLTQFYDI